MVSATASTVGAPSPVAAARPSRPPAADFRPEVQGLRAVAVGLVVLFHLWPHRLTGGYVGVDVFFVISGYLITSHLHREVVQTGSLRLGRFWARRIRRLLPASLVVLTASALAVLQWAPTTVWEQSSKQIAASALYVQNWSLALDSVDYMARDNAPTVAQHYWSLSVEEQFYAVWPVLILLLLVLHRQVRRSTFGVGRQRGVLVGGLAALAAGSLLWSIVSTRQDHAFAYLSTFTRVWEFAAGALTALVVVTLPRTASWVAGWVGLGAIAVTGYFYNADSLFPGWLALVTVLGTVAVLLSRPAGRSSAGWWLARRPATFVGDMSYSVYLVHWPLIVILPFALGVALHWQLKLLVLVLTVGLAWLLKVCVEDPLRLRPLLNGAPWRAFAFATTGMLLLVGLHLGVGAELDHKTAVAAAQTKARLAAGVTCLGPDALLHRSECGTVAGTGPLVGAPEVVIRENRLPIFRACQQLISSPALRTCHVGELTRPRRTVALVGDSHAGALVPMMDALGKRLHWDVVVHTKGSCPTTDARRVIAHEATAGLQQTCETWNRAVDQALLHDPTITDVFVASYSSAYTWANVPGSSLADPGVDGFQQMWRSWLAAGKRVHVLADVPRTSGRSIPTCVAQHRDPLKCATPRKKALAGDIAVTAARQMGDPRVTVVDLTPQFCDATWCYAEVGSVLVYRDQSHVSVTYSTLLAPFVAAQLPATLTRV